MKFVVLDKRDRLTMASITANQRFMTVMGFGGMRWTRQRRARTYSQGGLRSVSDQTARKTIEVAADGEVVWS